MATKTKTKTRRTKKRPNYASRERQRKYHVDLATRQHKIRASCIKCNQNKDSKNEHRFHGYGSFAETHISYCNKHNCCAQNEPDCYSAAQKKRYAKAKRKRKSTTKKK